MEPLDASQERELQFLRAQRSFPFGLSPRAKLLCAVALATTCGIVPGSVALVVGVSWLATGLATACIVALAALPDLVAPQKMLRLRVRMSVPSAASMRRGDSNRNWPG